MVILVLSSISSVGFHALLLLRLFLLLLLLNCWSINFFRWIDPSTLGSLL